VDKLPSSSTTASGMVEITNRPNPISATKSFGMRRYSLNEHFLGHSLDSLGQIWDKYFGRLETLRDSAAWLS
jgi:hypothetical protein